MKKIHKEFPKSFAEFVTMIDSYQKASDDPLWFRGTGRSSHPLKPGLYRHLVKKRPAELERMERELLSRFKLRSVPFHDKQFADDWENMFLMQHYRIPTRLLDWTENPVTALYFAVTQAHPAKSKAGTFTYDKPAAVWMLNPTEWNRYALRSLSYEEGPLSPEDQALKAYRILSRTGSIYPVALYGVHNSPRIVAQRGVFTVFGSKNMSMQHFYRTDGFPKGCLVKFVLTADRIPSVRQAVFRHGVTESVIFPDLEGLAQEIRRIFEFEG